MSLARAWISVLATAIVIAGIDAVATVGHPLAHAVAHGEVARGLLVVLALHMLVAIALAPVVAALASRARVRPIVRLLPSAMLGGLAVALNALLLVARPVPAVLLVLGLPLVHGAFVIALTDPRRRLWAIGFGTSVVTAVLVVNGWTFRGVSPHQHETLVLAAWAFAVPTAWVLTGASMPARRPARAWWLLVPLAALAMGSMPSGARLVLRETAPAARATLGLVGAALDVDRDGDPSWPGPDCAPLDPAIVSSAPDLAGDGIDQNCLAGDPSPAAVTDLQRRIAQPAAPRRLDPVRRLLLVTIDALRYDAVLPEIHARIGDRCTAIERAYSTSNETTYASYTLFTSRFSSQGVFDEIGPSHAPLRDPAVRLPEVLGEHGFATMALAFHHRFEPSLALSRGFAELWAAPKDAMSAVAGAETSDRAIAWLDGRKGPWFLWAHYYDAHEPYQRHSDVPVAGATPHDAYLGEVAYTDREIARLFDALGPTLDETAILVTADHGEAFGEHGQHLHGTDLFDEQVRVPMWICPPRSWPRVPTHRLASILDVAPTLLDLAGIERPSSFTGRSLLQVAHDVPVFAESIRGRRMQMIVADAWKLIRYIDGDVELLFDLAGDPAEMRDLAGLRDRERMRMEALLDVWTGLVARTRDR